MRFERIDHGSGETVLIVDDEAIVRILVAEVLTEKGYSLLEVGDGQTALRTIESDPRINLMITDIELPI